MRGLPPHIREQRIAEIANLQAQGLDLHRAAEALGMSAHKLQTRCVGLRVPLFHKLPRPAKPRRPKTGNPPGRPRFWTEDRIAELERLLKVERYSINRAAAWFGKTRGVISGIKHRHLPHLVRRRARPCARAGQTAYRSAAPISLPKGIPPEL